MKAHATRPSLMQKFTLMAGNLAAILPARTTSLNLGGQAITVASLVSDFQSGAGNGAAVTASRAATKAALTEEKAATPALRAKYTLVEDYLEATLGPTNPILEKVGIAPAKPKATPSTVTKRAAQLERQKTVKGQAAPKAAPISVTMIGGDGQPIPGSAGASATSSTPSVAAVAPAAPAVK